MKTALITLICSAAFGACLFAQDPVATPTAPAAATASAATPAAPTPAPVVSPSAASPTVRESDDDLESRIEKRVKKGLSITFGEGDEKDRKNRHADRHDFDGDFDEGALMAIPIVGIIFTTLFGAPVLVVGLIMFFNYWKARSLHKTVRMMVEKGQPVPEGLFAAPHTPARARSDMRRGVVLLMVGLGLMIFFGAMDDWDGGAWALGIIPFLIGAGYLLVWKLEGKKQSTDNAPRLS